MDTFPSKEEPHDFMGTSTPLANTPPPISVNAFSQLPFIRPSLSPTTLVQEQSNTKDKGIRLFGIEFGQNPPVPVDPITGFDEEDSIESISEETKEAKEADTGRKFECHYCCRNFPTSQALGGHQNAHKRERQHAKRLNFQSAIARSGAIDRVYGVMNYQHGFSWRNRTVLDGLEPPCWNNSFQTSHLARLASHNQNPSSSMHHGGLFSSYSHQHHLQPINGNPLPSLYRYPSVLQSNPSPNNQAAFHHSLLPLQLFSKEDSNQVNPNGKPSFSSMGTSQNHSTAALGKDYVSLDLHL